MIPNEENISDLIQKIQSVLRAMHPAQHLDLDGLAQDIILEAWSHGTPVTVQFIQHRYINSFNAAKSYRAALESKSRLPEGFVFTVDDPVYLTDHTEHQAKLNQIICAAKLTSREFEVVALIFFFSHTVQSAASHLGWSVSKLRTTLDLAFDRLRQAGRIVEASLESAEHSDRTK